MKNFNDEMFLSDMKTISWKYVYEKDNPDEALAVLNTLLLLVIEKHSPMKKQTVRNVKAPWLDEELRNLMKQREEAKKEAIMSTYESDWQIYKKLRNYVTVLNKKKNTNSIKKRFVKCKMIKKRCGMSLMT